jgi:hypothetical protein
MAETFNVPEELVEDYTGHGPWDINGEIYEFEDEFMGQGDGEVHEVVVKRQSDGKYFQFSWMLSRSENYYYEPEWVEVKPVLDRKWVEA